MHPLILTIIVAGVGLLLMAIGIRTPGELILANAPFVFIIAWLYNAFSTNSRRKKGLKRLRNSGFSVDHALDHSGGPFVAFNDKDRKVAFIYHDGTVTYDYADIRSWQITLDGVGSQLRFTLNDKQRPLVTVTHLTEGQARHWEAKVGAILATT